MGKAIHDSLPVMSISVRLKAGPAALAVAGLFVLACGGLELPLPTAPPEPDPVEVVPEPEVEVPRFYYVRGAAGVEDASFSQWKPGDRLFIGVDATNLRGAPEVGDNIVEKLDLGVEVEVVEVASEPVVLIGRRNAWYKIRTRTGTEGYLFGSVLSPLRVALYDGGTDKPRVGVITFSQEFGPRLRAWAPPDGPVFALDALPVEVFATGGTLSADSTDDAVTVTLCDPATNRCSEGIFGYRGGELVQLSPPVPSE